MTTYTFGPKMLLKVKSDLLDPPIQTLPLPYNGAAMLYTPFGGIRLECDPSLSDDAVEIRGTKDGKPYIQRLTIKT